MFRCTLCPIVGVLGKEISAPQYTISTPCEDFLKTSSLHHESVQAGAVSNLSLRRRTSPRRLVSAFPINHEFLLLEARLAMLYQVLSSLIQPHSLCQDQFPGCGRLPGTGVQFHQLRLSKKSGATRGGQVSLSSSPLPFRD